jgi:hypothetical protein
MAPLLLRPTQFFCATLLLSVAQFFPRRGAIPPCSADGRLAGAGSWCGCNSAGCQSPCGSFRRLLSHFSFLISSFLRMNSQADTENPLKRLDICSFTANPSRILEILDFVL